MSHYELYTGEMLFRKGKFLYILCNCIISYIYPVLTCVFADATDDIDVLCHDDEKVADMMQISDPVTDEFESIWCSIVCGQEEQIAYHQDISQMFGSNAKCCS